MEKMESVNYSVWGDSISLGYSPCLGKHLGERYAFLPLDENCGDSRGLLGVAEARLAQGRATRDLLILNAGLHDIKRYGGGTAACQVPLPEYGENLDRIFALLERTRARVVFVNTTGVIDELHNAPGSEFRRYDSDVLAVNEAAARVCEKRRVPLVDLYAFTKAFGTAAFADHVHYKPEVSDRQAGYIAGIIKATSGNLVSRLFFRCKPARIKACPRQKNAQHGFSEVA
jgi:lysophospholipase L1-like esterase